MASDLNARLAAILDKHPQLRPTGSDEPPHELKLFLHHGGLWCYSPSQEQVNADGYIDDDCAEALIFRAMVEQLPWPYELGRFDPGADSEWFIMSRTTAEVRAVGDTALDALVNFYEGAEHAK
jgi:hypothetical protein